MKYITVAEMDRTIRANIWKVPRDIDFVMGIPRSGVLAASLIAEYLNCPLIDKDSFCSGAKPTGGTRLRYWKPRHPQGKKKVLVVDDTVFDGRQKRKTKAELSRFSADYDFVYMVVYLEGPARDSIDIWLEDVSMYTNGFRDIVLYEWNIFHHNEDIMAKSIYDIDGVLCVNPPDERSGKEYLDYIADATPLFVPTAPLGGIVSYRLESNRAVTEDWLKRNGVQYRRLVLFGADSWDARNASGISPARFKGDYYRDAAWANLFVESDDMQAREIHLISGKAVYCVETNRMYC